MVFDQIDTTRIEVRMTGYKYLEEGSKFNYNKNNEDYSDAH